MSYSSNENIVPVTQQIKISESIPTNAIKLSENPTKLKIAISLEKIPAGFPSPAEQYVEDYLDFNEHLIKNRAATIVVYCGGESMKDAGISKNDLLVIDRSREPKNQDIVMADLGNEFTIKRLHIENGQVSLHSENTSANFPAFTFSREDTLTIVGVVTHVIKSF